MGRPGSLGDLQVGNTCFVYSVDLKSTCSYLAEAGTVLGRGRLGILIGGTMPGKSVDGVELVAVDGAAHGNLPETVCCCCWKPGIAAGGETGA